MTGDGWFFMACGSQTPFPVNGVRGRATCYEFPERMIQYLFPPSAVGGLHSCIRSPFVDGLLSRRAGKPVLHAPPSIHRPPSPVHRPLRSAVCCLRSISHPPTQIQASCARSRWEYPDALDPVPHHKSRGDERFAPPSHTASADIPALAHNLRRPSSRL